MRSMGSLFLTPPDEIAASIQKKMKLPYPDDFKITGRIKNNSPHFLRETGLKLHIHDCFKNRPANQEACDVVAEELLRVSTEVPPDQARNFSLPVKFKAPIVIVGEMLVEYKVTGTEALPGWMFSDDKNASKQ